MRSAKQPALRYVKQKSCRTMEPAAIAEHIVLRSIWFGVTAVMLTVGQKLFIDPDIACCAVFCPGIAVRFG